MRFVPEHKMKVMTYNILGGAGVDSVYQQMEEDSILRRNRLTEVLGVLQYQVSYPVYPVAFLFSENSHCYLPITRMHFSREIAHRFDDHDIKEKLAGGADEQICALAASSCVNRNRFNKPAMRTTISDFNFISLPYNYSNSKVNKSACFR